MSARPTEAAVMAGYNALPPALGISLPEYLNSCRESAAIHRKWNLCHLLDRMIERDREENDIGEQYAEETRETNIGL